VVVEARIDPALDVPAEAAELGVEDLRGDDQDLLIGPCLDDQERDRRDAAQGAWVVLGEDRMEWRELGGVLLDDLA
jgi:hypothetical protein